MREKYLKIFIYSLTGLFLLLSCSQPAGKLVIKDAPDLSAYQYQETKDIVALVYEAAELVEENGRNAFGEFRVKGGKWFFEDTYIFIWGLDGMRYVYPRDPSGEGENMLNLEDINGKPIGKMMVDTARNGEGWVFYEWTRPGEEKPVWKSTFVKKAVSPNRREYLVGAGKYGMRTEKIFVEQMVNDAAELLSKNGREIAFKQFNLKAGKFIFLNSYVFVKTIDGVELVNPCFPYLVGKDISRLKDAKGKSFIQDELNQLKTKDFCWMNYFWPKPGTKEPSLKKVYVKKVKTGQGTLVVGAGYFEED